MKIDFLSLRVPNLRNTIDFYVGLGLPILSLGKGYVVFRAGATVLMFELVDDRDDKPFYHLALDIPQNRLAQAEAWLSERVDLLQRDGQTQIAFEDWNATSVYFHDPTGNIIEMIARHNLKNDSEENFSVDSILRVSEIGWPCLMGIPDQDFELSSWRDHDGFKALGSETGLILVVNVGRPWVPTGRPAEAHPCTLVISDEKGSREFIRR